MDKVIPVVVIKDVNDTIPTLKALKDGGINCAEITFRTACAAEAIGIGVKEFPDMNIGAGTITANYNPLTKVKSKTIIKDNVKIGSNSVLVAPVTIDEGANVGAVGVITKDVPAWSLAVTRSPLKVLEGWVKKVLR